MSKKNSRTTIKYLILLFVMASFFLIPIANVRAGTTARWYAGYKYERSSYGSSSCPDGVMADIYCVSPVIPFGHAMFQFVCVVTSYSPNYWFQIGYLKRYTLVFIFPIVIWSFYTETHLSMYQNIMGFPLSTHWYNFRIWKKNSYSLGWAIYEGGTHLYSGFQYFYTDAIDLWAAVEVTNPSINIWTSHFKNIKYYSGGSWHLWNRWPPTYLPDEGDYYAVQTISAHEFKAWKR